MKKTYFEAQRFGLTEAKFKADMRFALKKIPELASFAEMIDRDMGHLADGHEPMHVTRKLVDDTNADDCTEILHDDEGQYQSYYKPSSAARALGATGYNFMYEFTYDDEKTGYGYLYIAIF